MKYLASMILAYLLTSTSLYVIAQTDDNANDAALRQKLETSEASRQKAPENIQVIDADPSLALLNKFMKANPRAREHDFDLPSTGINGGQGPALSLRHIWVGTSGTLVEVRGLSRSDKPNSAVMRRDTLVLVDRNGIASHLLDLSGAQELRDPRGGSAIVVHPGDTVYLLFNKINDYLPFGMKHSVDSGGTVDYFGVLDPRFRERYDEAYKQATTPDKMKDFIVEFARNDPGGHVREVFTKLIGLMRAQETFEGYYNSYLLLQDSNDLRHASRLARNDDHKAKIEHMAVATLVDKSRLIDFSVTPAQSVTDENEGSCWMACNYNFSARRPIKGVVSVQLNKKSPITLRHGNYRVTFSADVFVPRTEQRRSAWLGNRDGESNLRWSQDVVVELRPPSYRGAVDYDLGAAQLAFFQRGSMGGYEAHWSTGDPQVTFSYKQMELVK